MHSLALCCPELSFEHSISALELPRLQPTPQNTYMPCMHDLAIIIKRTMTPLLAAVLSRKIHFFIRCRLTRVYRLWSTRTKNNLQYFSRPGSFYRCHPPNAFRSRRAQPSKRERLGFPANLRGARAWRTRRQKGADCGLSPEKHPPDEHAEFRVPAP